ncbi:hypothetical protein OH76DRAFT_1061128 [Lentinus brumalis]|uniref:PH domain-containing protein n=1 Tax=Lentinus brumalis TaxID=2498619 RepID=A0A371DNJ5_9APHY|nr:hypothetical protein OH76DRAFT_1061128 [Polyporus brumalis]
MFRLSLEGYGLPVLAGSDSLVRPFVVAFAVDPSTHHTVTMSATFLSFLSDLKRLADVHVVFSRCDTVKHPAPNASDDDLKVSSSGTEEDRTFLSNLVRSIHARDTFHTLSVTLAYPPRRANSALDDILFNSSLETALGTFPNFAHLLVHPPSDNRSGTSGHQWQPHIALNMPNLRPMLAPANTVFLHCTEASETSVSEEQAFRIWCDGHLLVFPSGEYEALDLRNENRLLVHRGRLAIPTPWLEVYAFLFDNYLVITEPREVEGTMEYHTSRRPIPLSLLRVMSFHDPPFHRGHRTRPLSLYAFTLYHDSRVGGFLTLCTDSAHERHMWKEKFNIAFNLNEIGSEWSKAFATETLIPVRDNVDSTTTELESDVITGTITCSVLLTAQDGSKIVAVAGEDGLWMRSRCHFEPMQRVLHLKLITQCAVLEDYRILLVLADRVLFAYHIDSLIIPPGNASHRYKTQLVPQNVSKKHDVQFFSVGKQHGRTLVIYMRREGDDSIFSLLEPNNNIREASKVPPRPGESRTYLLDRLRPPRYLNVVREFFLPRKIYDAIFLKTYVALLCPRGFEILDTKEWVPEETRLSPLRFTSCDAA